MELISRADAIKDAESWTAVDEHERHLQKNVIEWLKEFPTAELSTNLAEVGTDCISRQAAIDALEKVAELYPWRVPGDRDSYSQYNEAWQDALNRADGEIEALPSAEPKQKKGKWERVYLDHVAFGERPSIFYCSSCNQCVPFPTNFCPACGSDNRQR